jgi:hypothetical protein
MGHKQGQITTELVASRLQSFVSLFLDVLLGLVVLGSRYRVIVCHPGVKVRENTSANVLHRLRRHTFYGPAPTGTPVGYHHIVWQRSTPRNVHADPPLGLFALLFHA